MTFLAALRRDRIDAPWVLDGPINGETFKTNVRNELLKTLKNRETSSCWIILAATRERQCVT